MAGKTKAKVKTRVKLIKHEGKPIKPNMGRGTSGVIPVSLRLKVEKDRNEKEKKGGRGG